MSTEAFMTSDDILIHLSEMPAAYRVTVLALMGEQYPEEILMPLIRPLLPIVTRWTEEKRIGEAQRVITQIETLRSLLRNE